MLGRPIIHDRLVGAESIDGLGASAPIVGTASPAPQGQTGLLRKRSDSIIRPDSAAMCRPGCKENYKTVNMNATSARRRRSEPAENMGGCRTTYPTRSCLSRAGRRAQRNRSAVLEGSSHCPPADARDIHRQIHFRAVMAGRLVSEQLLADCHARFAALATI